MDVPELLRRARRSLIEPLKVFDLHERPDAHDVLVETLLLQLALAGKGGLPADVLVRSVVETLRVSEEYAQSVLRSELGRSLELGPRFRVRLREEP